MKKSKQVTAYDFSAAWARGNAIYTKWTNAQNVNYPTFRVLYALSRKESLTQKEIVDYFGLTKQSVNTVIRQLREEGYVTLELGIDDRREKYIHLTATGKKYATEFLTPLLRMEERVCANIDPKRLSDMHETLELFNLLLEREMSREK